MKHTIIKAALAAALAAAALSFREMLAPLAVLCAVMASDYVTGVMEAYKSGSLSSRAGLAGILKKLAYLFGVGVAVTVDFVVHTAGARLGADLSGRYAFGLLVTFWLILNECLSILENLAALGVPVPGFLRKVVERLKRRAENAAPVIPSEAEGSFPAQEDRIDAGEAGDGDGPLSRCATAPLGRGAGDAGEDDGHAGDAL